MQIKDNFLSEEEFNQLNKTFHLANFPWYFIPFKVQPDDDYYQFYHLFVAKGKIHSKYYDILHPILTKLEVKKILRIKANLTLKQSTNTSSEMHIDFKDCKTSIFYLNSNNGYTQFERGDKIISKENRVVVFDSNLKHCAVDCTDTKYRIVINFNYL